MAQSPQVTTTLFIPSAPGSDRVTMDPFFRPGAIGNGRIWVSGTITPGSYLAAVRYRVNNQAWRTEAVDLESQQKFGFYITGVDPSDWGTTVVTELQQPEGTYYYAPQVIEKPTLVSVAGEIYEETNSLSNLTIGNRRWFWDAAESKLYFRDPADVFPTSDVLAIIDPIFEQGKNYTVEIEVEDEIGQTAPIVVEEFTWPYQVRNYVDRYLNNLLPEYAQDSPAWRKIYTLLAKQAADKYSMMDDVMAQSFIEYTTWGIGMWEDQLGLPTIPSLTLETRRNLLRARKKIDASRNDFFDSILLLAPGAVITETYGEFRVDIKLTGVPNLALRRALEKIIQEKKPVGIRVVVSYGQFIAGISLAGDSL